MPTGVMGTLKQMGVVDICHMLEMGKKDAVIDLHSTDGLAGQLCFTDGHVSFCTWGNLVAEEAFYDLCRRKEGFFRIHYGRKKAERNIEGMNQFLLLEAMRRLDDESRAMPKAPGMDEAPSPPQTPMNFGPPSFHGEPDVTIPQGEPVQSEEGPELPPAPRTPFGPPPLDASAADKLPAPPPPPGVPAPIRPGPPVGLREPPPAPPRTGAPPSADGGRASRSEAREPHTGAEMKPTPATPATPAPVEGMPTMPVRAIREEDDDNTNTGTDTATDTGARGDTLIWDSEQEQALREAAGKPAPEKGFGETFKEAWNEQLGPAFAGAGKAWLDLNGQVAGALEKNPALASTGAFVRAKPWALPAVAASFLLGMFLVVALAFAFAGAEPAADAAVLARIDGGQAAAVLAEIEAVPDHERSAVQELERGHALSKLGRDADALDAYRRAQALGLTDRRAMGVALRTLAEPQPTVAMEYLIAFGGDAVNGELVMLTGSESWQRRHNAVYVLEQRGAVDVIDREQVAALDLLTGPTCRDRKQGLLDLRKVGRTEKAREAFNKALALKDTDNACMRRELSQMAGR
jgi:tetratricopeptide (TPR) repeat protein